MKRVLNVVIEADEKNCEQCEYRMRSKYAAIVRCGLFCGEELLTDPASQAKLLRCQKCLDCETV